MHDLLPIIEHARMCKAHVPIYEHFFVGKYRHDGEDFNHENQLPEIEDVDLDKIPAGLILNLTNDASLSSNGIPRDFVENRQLRVVFSQNSSGQAQNRPLIPMPDGKVLLLDLEMFNDHLNKDEIRIWLDNDEHRIYGYGVEG